MTCWYHLSLELWDTVFQNLSKPDLIQCQLACHHWQEIVSKVIYTDITLSTDTQTIALINTFVQPPCVPGSHLRRISLNIPFRTVDIQAIIHQLAITCPLLESIALTQPCHRFYQQITTELELKRLRHLNQLPFPEPYGDAIESYTRTITYLRHQIKTVKFSDHLSPLFFREVYRPLIENMADFVRLESVVFEKRKECTLSETVNLFDSLSSIKHIQLILHQPSPLDIYVGRPFVRPNVRRFTINRMTGLGNAFLYLKAKFPNLKHLAIEASTDDCPDTMPYTTCLPKQWLDTYLYRLQSFRIEGIDNMLTLAHVLKQQQALPGHLQIKIRFDVTPEGIQCAFDLDYRQDMNNNRRVHLLILNSSSGGQSIHLLPILNTFGGLVDELTLWHTGERYGEEHGLDDCSRLQKLCLKNYRLTGSRIGPSPSISQLTLVKCTYTSTALTALSQQLPLLNRLEIVKSRCTEDSTLVSHIDCSMPHIHFSLLQYQWSCLRRLSDSMYLQLTMKDRPQRHYRIKTGSAYLIAEQEYRHYLLNPDVLTMDLSCKAIDCLDLTDSELSIHHSF